MRPYGLINSECPLACAPANGQTYSQVSNFHQKPGYVKRAAHRRPHQNSNIVYFLFNQKVQKAAAPESCRSVPRRHQPSAVLSPIRCKTLLDGGRRRTKIYMVFLREPSRRDRSGSDLFHLRDGFEIKMNFDRNVSCFIFVNALMHDDFFD